MYFDDGNDANEEHKNYPFENEHSKGRQKKAISGSSYDRGRANISGTGLPDYLENNVIRFVYLLRSAGIQIGSSEVIDALHALQLIPLTNKEYFKATLKATLIKKASDQELFARYFVLFFASPETRKEFQEARREKLIEHRARMEEAEKVLSFRGERMDLSETDKIVYAYMPAKEQKRLQDFLAMNESRETLEQDYRPFLETIVKGRLGFWHKQLGREIEEELNQPDVGDEGLNAIRDAAAGAGRGGSNILTEDMQNIARKDLPRATAIIRKMTRLLVYRISRRYRYSKNRRKLDLRSTIRCSIQYGGTPFLLKYKSRRRKKPQLLLLCDVSGSMIRYTNFVLQFIYGLNTVVKRIESFVFSEGLERITPYFQQGKNFDSTIESIIKESKQWGGGTSLDRAIKSLFNSCAEELNRNTIVIIVSDTRTVRHRNAIKEVQRLRDEVKEIIWLNTLPQGDWDKYSSVQAFQKIAAMFPCNTLTDLEQVLGRKLFFDG
ncbi:MAG: VWA domain-containing protein [Firmicutes bacterium]|nr:VWA domain-containing protein [Bacillota bacterium]